MLDNIQNERKLGWQSLKTYSLAYTLTRMMELTWKLMEWALKCSWLNSVLKTNTISVTLHVKFSPKWMLKLIKLNSEITIDLLE